MEIMPPPQQLAQSVRTGVGSRSDPGGLRPLESQPSCSAVDRYGKQCGVTTLIVMTSVGWRCRLHRAGRVSVKCSKDGCPYWTVSSSGRCHAHKGGRASPPPLGVCSTPGSLRDPNPVHPGSQCAEYTGNPSDCEVILVDSVHSGSQPPQIEKCCKPDPTEVDKQYTPAGTCEYIHANGLKCGKMVTVVPAGGGETRCPAHLSSLNRRPCLHPSCCLLTNSRYGVCSFHSTNNAKSELANKISDTFTTYGNSPYITSLLHMNYQRPAMRLKRGELERAVKLALMKRHPSFDSTDFTITTLPGWTEYGIEDDISGITSSNC